jgi:glycosyltransferase involved in cell wall biosynthesis
MAQKQQKVKILFATMVKNESKIILKMLESVAPYIDYWVIEDTGSTDGTQDIINTFFKEKNIPGFLYHEDWKFHGYNRDHVLQKALSADSGCEFILRVDADEWLEVDEGFDWDLLKTQDSWQIPSYHGNMLVNRKWMWRTSLPWYFKHDPIHETIHCDVPHTSGNLPLSFRIIVAANGVSYENPKKYLKDALDMEHKLIFATDKEKAKEDLYHLWYIGKSYYDAAGASDSYLFGQEHSKEYWKRSKFYFENYLKLINKTGDKPQHNEDDWVSYTYLLLGRLGDRLGEPVGDILDNYLKSHAYSPRRAEGLLAIAEHYFYKDNMPLAYIYTSKLVKLKNPFPDCMSFIEANAYVDTGWQSLDMHSVASYWCGHYQESVDCCKQLLNSKLLPLQQLTRVKDNLNHALYKL